MDCKGEAPSMYEMEGASRSCGCEGPIARARESAEPATIARQCLDRLRSTRCPPSRKAPSGSGSPVRCPVANSGSKGSLPRTPFRWCSLTRRFPPELGHRRWWRARFLSPPNELRKRLEEAISRFFTVARLIHRSGYVTPRSRRVVHQLSTSSSTPATRYWPRQRHQVLAETTGMPRGEMAERWAARRRTRAGWPGGERYRQPGL
jgi:hypothetical protein